MAPSSLRAFNFLPKLFLFAQSQRPEAVNNSADDIALAPPTEALLPQPKRPFTKSRHLA
jgi:hypothetical protein